MLHGIKQAKLSISKLPCFSLFRAHPELRHDSNSVTVRMPRLDITKF